MAPMITLLLGLVVLVLVEVMPGDTIGAVLEAALRGIALVLLPGSARLQIVGQAMFTYAERDGWFPEALE